MKKIGPAKHRKRDNLLSGNRRRTTQHKECDSSGVCIYRTSFQTQELVQN